VECGVLGAKNRPVYAACGTRKSAGKGFILPTPKMASNHPQARFRAFFVKINLRNCSEIISPFGLPFFRRTALQSLAEPSGSSAFCALPGEKILRQIRQVVSIQRYAPLKANRNIHHKKPRGFFFFEKIQKRLNSLFLNSSLLKKHLDKTCLSYGR
jgi:hypothetical protein